MTLETLNKLLKCLNKTKKKSQNKRMQRIFFKKPNIKHLNIHILDIQKALVYKKRLYNILLSNKKYPITETCYSKIS